ncbi:MAG: hypothetical protein LAT68_07155 [Cyclobacteriaceae bacterium]|nr:hypothetical protein [Cyclobacteriaceae bacterium]MCH8516092.1 hypothetical protein [Cyclobacteriaceae bacterium]
MSLSFIIWYILRYGLSIVFFIAAVHHLNAPDFYIPLIPVGIPIEKEIVNYLVVFIEFSLAIGLIITQLIGIFRLLSAGYLLLLVAAHIHFIQMGSCIENSLCVPEWISYVRLIIIHPLLIMWALFTPLLDRKAKEAVKQHETN